MNRQKALKILNPAMFVVFLATAGGGIAKLSGAVDYMIFKKFHPPAGILLITLAILHLCLNWPWVKQQFGAGRK